MLAWLTTAHLTPSLDGDIQAAMCSTDTITMEKHPPAERWDVEELIKRALKVKANAAAPLSGFRVGSAVLTKTGNIYEGCNTESLIPVLGVCAERNAINHALIHGENSFLAVAVVSDLHTPLLPCGACLQYIQEFSRNDDRDVLVIAQGRSGDRIITSVNELFKGGFSPETSVREIQESFRWSIEDEA